MKLTTEQFNNLIITVSQLTFISTSNCSKIRDQMLGITKIILKQKITKKKKIETTDLQERNGTKDLYQKCKVRNDIYMQSSTKGGMVMGFRHC